MRLLNAGKIPANLIWPPFAVVLFACLPAWALYGIGKLAAIALTKWTEFAVMFSYLGGIAGFAATFFTQNSKHRSSAPGNDTSSALYDGL